MLDVGAAPLAIALGFDPPAALAPLKDAVAATLGAGSNAVALLVTVWGSRLDPFWRAGVTEAARRSAGWCLLFNGTSLRLLDAGRLYAATKLGIQVCDQAGRVNCILPLPNSRCSNVVFGGANFDTLYVTSAGMVWKRKLNTKGSPSFLAPIKPAAPHL